MPNHLQKISYISLMPTIRCNFQCQSCFNWKVPATLELPLVEWEKIVASLIKNFDGSTFVEINGGEPLLRRDDIIQIVRKLKTHFQKVVLNTNGYFLDPNTIDALEAAGLDVIKMSLYSLNPTTHNDLRGAVAFDQAMQALRYHQEKNSAMEFRIAILITSKNIQEVPALIDYLVGLRNVVIRLNALTEIYNSEKSADLSVYKIPEALWPKAEAIEKVFECIMAHKDKIKTTEEHLKTIKEYYLNPASALEHPCRVHESSLIITSDGKVSLCYKLPPFGDARGDLAQLLDSPEAEAQRTATKHCRKGCRILACNFINQAN